MARGSGAGSTSGPLGNALLPPSWLRTVRLPFITYAAGSSWLRCHKEVDGPVFFGPGVGLPPRHRFDAPAGEYRVLYVGLDYEAAFIETFLRNPKRRIIDRIDLEIRNMTVLENDAPLRLVEAHAAGLSRIGTTVALSTGGYKASRAWSLALWDHPDRPDGLVYLSRHNPTRLCAAIFNRSHATFSVDRTDPLLADERHVRDLLTAHGKSVG